MCININIKDNNLTEILKIMHNFRYISLSLRSQNMMWFYISHKLRSHHLFVLTCLAIIFSILAYSLCSVTLTFLWAISKLNEYGKVFILKQTHKQTNKQTNPFYFTVFLRCSSFNIQNFQHHTPKNMLWSSSLTLSTFAPRRLEANVQIILLSSEVSRVMTKFFIQNCLHTALYCFNGALSVWKTILLSICR